MATKEVAKEVNDKVKRPNTDPTVDLAEEEERVPIKLFKGEGYEDDVWVGRNGRGYLIQRGVEVMVPKGIKEILENQERMDNLAAERIQAAIQRTEIAKQ